MPSEFPPKPGTTIRGRTWDGNQWRIFGGICVGPPLDIAPTTHQPSDQDIDELERSLDATVPRSPFD